MFRVQSALHQEVNDADCTYAALAVAQDGHLQRVTIPEAAYVQFVYQISNNKKVIQKEAFSASAEKMHAHYATSSVSCDTIPCTED